MANLRAAGLERVPVVVGGIIPPADAERLRRAGIAAVYTPKDFKINAMLGAIIGEIEARSGPDRYPLEADRATGGRPRSRSRRRPEAKALTSGR
jgi:hypothetical protein